eukprot:403363583
MAKSRSNQFSLKSSNMLSLLLIIGFCTSLNMQTASCLRVRHIQESHQNAYQLSQVSSLRDSQKLEYAQVNSDKTIELGNQLSQVESSVQNLQDGGIKKLSETQSKSIQSLSYNTHLQSQLKGMQIGDDTVNTKAQTTEQTPVDETDQAQFSEFLRTFMQQQNDGSHSNSINFQDFIQRKPVLIFLGALFTVLICCLFSQCLVRVSKNYNLTLNKYYSKKRYEKAKMIQQYLDRDELVKFGQDLENSINGIRTDHRRDDMQGNHSSSNASIPIDEQTPLRDHSVSSRDNQGSNQFQ